MDKENKKDMFDYISPFTRKYIKPVFDFFFGNKIRALVIVIAIVLVILFASLIKQAFIISLLILLGGVSKIYERYFHVRLGIEFIMLATVVCGFIYGPFIGAIVGFVTFLLATYFSGRFSHNLFPSFVMITIVGIVTPLFPNVTIAGIVLTLIYDIIFAYVYIAWFRGRIHKIALFTITHFFWNLWVFTTIAPLVVNAIQ